MPGLGKYKKGAKFTLKSGNNPAFKMMAGESPITMKDFGIGKGTSPYKQDPVPTDTKPDDSKVSSPNEPVEKKKDSGWKKAADMAIAGLSGGLNAVYGSKIPIGKSSDRLKKDDKEVVDKSPGELWLEGQEAGEKLKAEKAATAEKERLAAEKLKNQPK